MIIEKIGNRGVFFTFQTGDSPLDGDTSVYLINTENRLFLCDTHLGPESMKVIKKYIEKSGWNNKEIIIFNSHADWDHIWGNCAFKDSTIIANKSCRERMRERGPYDLDRYKGIFHDGSVELVLPNLTFEKKLIFEEEEIEFSYAPGHTVDSAICYDKKESILFIGDLVEEPHPYLNHFDLESYIMTLKMIKNIQARTILSGHSGAVNEKIINNNLDFISKFIDQNAGLLPRDDYYDFSSKYFLMLRYENMAREKLLEKFDYRNFKRNFWQTLGVSYKELSQESKHIKNIEYEELEKSLKAYIKKILN